MAFLSAHDLIYIRYKIKIQRRGSRQVTFRDWSGFDRTTFRAAIEVINWSDLLTSNDIDVS